MSRMRDLTTVGVAATALSVLAAPAAAHGGTAGVGVPGWAVLLGSVLGLWVVVCGGVVVADRLLRPVLGTR
ncbi:hypothetical protein [Halomarina litorea]|uniref:hypothetical protein n=1 Tax=Halomarina litorea TaxID=2961595 RepID=UPI0020C49FDB|nr:hypothetical protein [Halomarina sp. BCD28]